jgi:dTDP-4-dehydrorhamnose reductase
MSQTKSLIVGASGQVGTQMLGALGERALPTSRVVRDSWLVLDVAELAEAAQAAALLDAQELDAIYCVGGMTWVDGCEKHPELAQRTNARGPGVLAEYARRRGVPYVFFSTDYVFDGAKEHPGPYAEDAPPHPLSVYGATKLEGERRVLEAYPEALVLRTTWVYGADARQMNSLYSMMRSLAAGKAMPVPVDQLSTPTYNRYLVRAALALVEARAAGLFHVAGPELLGRLEFLQRVALALGLEAQLLESVATAELLQPAARPLDSGLAIGKLTTQYPQLRMRTPAEALEDCGADLRDFLLHLSGNATTTV